LTLINVREAAPAEDLAFHRQPAALVVGEAQSSGSLRCAQHPVLLEQVVDDRLLLSVDPPGEQQAEEREGWRQRIHRGSVPDALPRFKSNVDWAEFPEERAPPAASIPPFYGRSDVGGVFAPDGVSNC